MVSKIKRSKKLFVLLSCLQWAGTSRQAEPRLRTAQAGRRSRPQPPGPVAGTWDTFPNPGLGR